MDNNFLAGLEELEKQIENELKKKIPKKEVSPRTVSEKKVEEKDILFDKTYTCPVCENVFKSKTIKTGKNRLMFIDTDLRPVFRDADGTKYDVVACGKCGYAALTRYFAPVHPRYIKMILEKITPSFKGLQEEKEQYSYEESAKKYRLALVSAVIRQGKNSEKAYICLKLSWLYRGMQEALDPEEKDYEEKKQRLQAEEKEYSKKAYEGFMLAMQKETFPICGMDDSKYTYLCADLARRNKDYTISVKLLSQVLVSRNAGTALKNKARDLYDVLKEESKEKSG